MPEPGVGGPAGEIAYVAGADPQIHLLDLETGESRQLTALTSRDAELTSQWPLRPAISCFFGPQSLTWSPDGTQLAFAYGGCEAVVYVIDPQGTLNRIADGHSPTWSPDGSRLLFSPNVPFCPAADRSVCGEPPRPGDWNLQVADLATSEGPGPLTLDEATAFGGQASYSGDGTLIAYAGQLPDPARDPELFGATYVIDADGSSARLVARGAWPAGWLPDDRLVLVDERTSIVRALDLESTDAVSLGRTSSTVMPSPDGRHLVLTGTDPETGAVTSIIVTTVDGAVVADLPGDPWAWAPDGSAIAVLDAETGAIGLVDVNGSEGASYRLPDPMNAFSASWRPGP